MKIVQCWDDGVEDDLRLMEILRRHGAKASFNLNPGMHKAERGHDWQYKDKTVRRLARHELVEAYEGFLIANHTVSHPRLQLIPLDEAEREIREGREQLEQIFGYPVIGFAYPFGTYNEDVQQLIRQAGHLYARTVQNVDQAFPPTDPTAFHPHCHFKSPDFWLKFEAERARDGIFYFWGHSYELITEDEWTAFEDQIRRLSAVGEWANLPDLFQTGTPVK